MKATQPDGDTQRNTETRRDRETREDTETREDRETREEVETREDGNQRTQAEGRFRDEQSLFTTPFTSNVHSHTRGDDQREGVDDQKPGKESDRHNKESQHSQGQHRGTQPEDAQHEERQHDGRQDSESEHDGQRSRESERSPQTFKTADSSRPTQRTRQTWEGERETAGGDRQTADRETMGGDRETGMNSRSWSMDLGLLPPTEQLWYTLKSTLDTITRPMLESVYPSWLSSEAGSPDSSDRSPLQSGTLGNETRTAKETLPEMKEQGTGIEVGGPERQGTRWSKDGHAQRLVSADKALEQEVRKKGTERPPNAVSLPVIGSSRGRGWKSKFAFSFSPAGLLLPYHLGALDYLTSEGYVTEDTPLAGSSAGSLAVVISALNIPLDVAMKTIYALEEDLRTNGTAYRLKKAVEEHMERILPDDAHLRLNRRRAPVFVTYTHVARLKGVLVSRFESKRDLIACLCASCNIPFYFSRKPTLKCRGYHCVDGYFSDRKNFGCPDLPAEYMGYKLVRILPFSATDVLHHLKPSQYIAPDLSTFDERISKSAYATFLHELQCKPVPTSTCVTHLNKLPKMATNATDHPPAHSHVQTHTTAPSSVAPSLVNTPAVPISAVTTVTDLHQHNSHQDDTRQGDTRQGDAQQGDTRQGDTHQGHAHQGDGLCSHQPLHVQHAKSAEFVMPFELPVGVEGQGLICSHSGEVQCPLGKECKERPLTFSEELEKALDHHLGGPNRSPGVMTLPEPRPRSDPFPGKNSVCPCM